MSLAGGADSEGGHVLCPETVLQVNGCWLSICAVCKLVHNCAKLTVTLCHHIHVESELELADTETW